MGLWAAERQRCDGRGGSDVLKGKRAREEPAAARPAARHKMPAPTQWAKQQWTAEYCKSAAKGLRGDASRADAINELCQSLRLDPKAPATPK